MTSLTTSAVIMKVQSLDVHLSTALKTWIRTGYVAMKVFVEERNKLNHWRSLEQSMYSIARS